MKILSNFKQSVEKQRENCNLIILVSILEFNKQINNVISIIAFQEYHASCFCTSYPAAFPVKMFSEYLQSFLFLGLDSSKH